MRCITLEGRSWTSTGDVKRVGWHEINLLKPEINMVHP